jgi:NAD(P)-dependent dehydrogenase (short-subunit alcohol dehydrogenase family)
METLSCKEDRLWNLGAGLFAVGVGMAAGVMAARAARRLIAPPMDLHGKVVLITGGSRGLGFVMAQEFARRGARVAICARDRLELSKARARIMDAAHNGDIFALTCDVTDRYAVERMVHTVEQRLAGGAGIDILVNNAGIITLGPLEEMTADDFEAAMNVHFWGPLHATMAALPGMKARGSGGIVNISSIGGKIGVPHLAPYCASKFALQGLTESLHAELAKDGISVTAICPGIMRTGGHLNSAYKGRHRHEFEWMNAFNLAPGFSVSAEYAARRIVDAAASGRGELVIGVPAKIADKLHALVPGAFLFLEGLAARLLPRPGGIGRATATGLQSEPGILPRWLKQPIYETAERHNQFAAMGGAPRAEGDRHEGSAAGEERLIP